MIHRLGIKEGSNHQRQTGGPRIKEGGEKGFEPWRVSTRRLSPDDQEAAATTAVAAGGSRAWGRRRHLSRQGRRLDAIGGGEETKQGRNKMRMRERDAERRAGFGLFHRLSLCTYIQLNLIQWLGFGSSWDELTVPWTGPGCKGPVKAITLSKLSNIPNHG